MAFVAAVASVAALPLIPSTANAETVSSTLSGGTLTVTTQPFTFTAATLTGANTNITASPGTAWSLVDARGTGAAWTATISSTALTSAAGTTETTARTIEVGQLSMANGTVTAGAGADPISTTITSTPVTLSGTAQTYIASSGTNKGTYTFSPTMTLAVPANAYRSNYASGNTGTQNPYTGTLTLTISSDRPADQARRSRPCLDFSGARLPGGTAQRRPSHHRLTVPLPDTRTAVNRALPRSKATHPGRSGLPRARSDRCLARVPVDLRHLVPRRRGRSGP
jgi:hypothetical protein